MAHKYSFQATGAQLRGVIARRLSATSLVVGIITVVATCVVFAELTFLYVAQFGPLRGLPLEDVLDAMRGDELELPVGRTLYVLTLCFLGAMPVALWVCRVWRHFVLDHWDADDRRHVGYAWSSGVMGLLCVFVETVSPLEFLSEDLLIGAGGLNMLVEEMRLLRHRYPDAHRQPASYHSPGGTPSTRPRKWRLAQFVVALGVLWVAVGLARQLSAQPTRAGSPLIPSPDPAAPQLELHAEPRDRGAVLRWTVCGPSGSSPMEYQKALLGDTYDRVEDISGPGHVVVGGLANGRVYAFRMRVKGQDVWSKEVTLVPMPEVEAEQEQGRPACGQLGAVLFRRDTYSVDARFEGNGASLNEIVGSLQEKIGSKQSEERLQGRVVATGYASARGRASYNLDLSEKRATRVAAYLQDELEGSSLRVAVLAMGERHDEDVHDRTDERHQQVVVSWCDEPALTVGTNSRPGR